MEDKKISNEESLKLITSMINQVKESYHDTGIAAIMWGSVIAVCSLVSLAELHFGFRLPFNIYWLTVTAAVVQVYLTVREKKQREVVYYDDRYMDFIWLSFGIALGLLIFIINFLFKAWVPVHIEYTELAGHKPSFVLSEFIAPFFLLLYGLPTFITGTACKFRPMLWGALVCWACCIITVFTTIKTDYALLALSATMAWLIPGVLMEKEYKTYKRSKTAATDV